MQILRKDLDRFCPRPKFGARADIWDAYATALERSGPAFRAASMEDPSILTCALGQWAHECDGFTLLWESGAYTAAGILHTFGKGKHSAAVTPAEAAEIAALPMKDDARARVLFERVYGLGCPKMAAELGNTEPGDGYKYRGFGIQQITGKRDHQRYLGFDYTADAAVRAAIAEWSRKGCNDPAKAGDITRVTKLINGGKNGLDERKLYTAQARTIWLNNHESDVDVAEIDVPEEAQPEAVSEAMAGSRKVSTVNAQGAVAKGVIALTGTSTALGFVGQVSDTLQPLQQMSGMLNDLAKDHVTLLLLVLAGAVWFGGILIKSYMRQDIAEGRYQAR